MNRLFYTLRLLLISTRGSIVVAIAIAIFLELLHLVSVLRLENQNLIFFLPIVGVLTVYIYKKYGKGAEKGNNLIIRSVHKEVKVPFRMAIFATLSNLFTQLTGGSIGIEGTAIQVGGTIFNRISAPFKSMPKERKVLVMAGISSAFSAAFGTPLAGAFFGLEMSFIGKISYETVLPCLLSAYVANYVTHLIGITHSAQYHFTIQSFDIKTIIIVVLSAFIFGLVGRFFSYSIKQIKSLYAKAFKNYLLRIFVAGVVIVALIFTFSLYDYAGLSNWMRVTAFSGASNIWEPITKFLLTVLTLGGGFKGGEVTPLFNLGASLGSVIGQTTNVFPALLAGLGMIAVFGSATNAPLTTIMLGIELFGTEAVPYYIIVAFIGYYVAGHHGIYTEQVIAVEKMSLDNAPKIRSIEEYNNRRLEFYNTKKLIKKFKERHKDREDH